MDLSALFGPPTVFLTSEQASKIAEVAARDGVVGVGIAAYAPTYVGVVESRPTVEGGRAIPGESQPEGSTEILVDFFGNSYDSGSDDTFESASRAAQEATASLQAEVDAYFEGQREEALV